MVSNTWNLLVHGGLVLLTSSSLLLPGVDACTSPTPLDGSVAGISTQSVQTLMSTLNLPYLFLPMAETIIGAIVSNYETPIQVKHKTNRRTLFLSPLGGFMSAIILVHHTPVSVFFCIWRFWLMLGEIVITWDECMFVCLCWSLIHAPNKLSISTYMMLPFIVPFSQ